MRRERLVALVLAVVTALWAVAGQGGSVHPLASGIIPVIAALMLLCIAIRPAASLAARKAAFYGCIGYSLLMIVAGIVALRSGTNQMPVLGALIVAGLLLSWRVGGQRRRYRRPLFANYHYN